MSELTREETLALMAWADGELEGEEAAAAEALLERAEARAFVDALSVLGDGVRAAEAGRPLPLDGLLEAVMARLPEADGDRAAKVRTEIAPIDRAVLKRQGRTRAAVVGGTLLAMAAAAVAYVHTQPNETASRLPAKPPVAVAVRGVQVDTVEAAENREVSVFYVSGKEGSAEDESPSVVVWIDDPGQGGAP